MLSSLGGRQRQKGLGLKNSLEVVMCVTYTESDLIFFFFLRAFVKVKMMYSVFLDKNVGLNEAKKPEVELGV
jgi:hypothetical protein